MSRLSDLPAHPVAIVTGANQGIGAAIARRLAADGAHVLATYLSMPPLNDPGNTDAYDIHRAADAAGVVEAIRSAGGVAESLEVDLAADGAAVTIFETAEQRLGPVSILVNNASSWIADTYLVAERDDMNRRLASVGAASFDQQFGVDARATALLIAEFARRSDGPGRILTMTSAGRDGWPGEVSYAAAKRAGESYTLSAGLELRSRGITANCLKPPPTDTGWVSDQVRVAIESEGMRVAQPDEVAEVAAWLCSDAARSVTGTIITME